MPRPAGRRARHRARGNINATVDLPVGGIDHLHRDGTVVAGATGSLTNTATVSVGAGVTDPDSGNNTATDTDTLTPTADLVITKTDGATTAIPGTSVTYTIVASNAGPVDDHRGDRHRHDARVLSPA